MQSLKQFTSSVAPLNRANIDTDAIIPKQFLKSIKRTGFEDFLFYEWRYLLDQSTADLLVPNPDFVLNRPEYRDARILLAQDNFGCGSSREHAPWALSDYGFRVIIAPSFADIFYNNCFKNGILPIVLAPEKASHLFTLSEQTLSEQTISEQTALTLEVDLEKQCISSSQLDSAITFEIEPNRKEALLLGLDDIDQTLQLKSKIENFEQAYQAKYPWLFLSAGARV
ncbi:MAG: 3-isopropylmalate dehydratase small subunit [Gammaproteobacteria bacterium]|nr:3-isopropylmalate dehydratase small subunit [Gammaproteobacteria bacterium]